MKHFKKLFYVVVLSTFATNFNAQYYGGGISPGNTQITLETGDVAGLKGLHKFNIKYDYSKMGVGSFRNETEYLAKKQADYKDEPEKFEKFKQSWFETREKRYEPKFEEMFNKMGEGIEFVGTNYATDGEVTILVETVFTEPGYHVGVVKRPASIDLVCTFTNQSGKEIVRYFIKNAIGSSAMGFDYDAGSRLVESYAKGCKVLMKDITKRLKKVK